MINSSPNMRDYESTRKSFHLETPPDFNFTIDVVEKRAEDPDRVALIIADARGDHFEEHTFSSLARDANRFANALKRRGVGRGETVLVMLPRTHEWHDCLLGMFKAGVIPVPTTSQCTSRDLLYRLRVCEASAVVTDAEGARKLSELGGECPRLKARFLVGKPEDEKDDFGVEGWESFDDAIAAEKPVFTLDRAPRADDPMLVYFTSGTVAHPKMVLHTQASYARAHEITSRFWQDLKPNELHWTITDLGWAKAAWGGLFGQWIIGCRVFLHNSARFEARATLHLLAKAGVNSFCAPPTAYRVLIHEDFSGLDLSRLRHCVSAGEPLNPEILNAWKKATGHMIYDGYGQTETVNLIANYPCLPVKAGSMGKPTPGFDVRIVDENACELPPNHEGQIAIKVKPERPMGLFAGYWKDDEANARVFKGDYYLTGDKARMDSDGYFWFIGRNDDVIITSGYRVGPFEVENALIEHPAVLEAAAVASPDETRGEVVKAFVVLRPGWNGDSALTQELQNHARRVTAPYKYPRRIEFVNELPKTISGKIRRSELKRREYERAGLIKA